MEKNNHTLTSSQLSTLLNVSKPTLRYWEKEFDGILVPRRTAGGRPADRDAIPLNTSPS